MNERERLLFTILGLGAIGALGYFLLRELRAPPEERPSRPPERPPTPAPSPTPRVKWTYCPFSPVTYRPGEMVTLRACALIENCYETKGIVAMGFPGGAIIGRSTSDCLEITIDPTRYDTVKFVALCGGKVLDPTCDVTLKPVEEEKPQPTPAPTPTPSPAPGCPDPPKGTVKVYETSDGHKVAIVETRSAFGGPWYKNFVCISANEVPPNCKCEYIVMYKDCAGGTCRDMITSIVAHGKDLPAWIDTGLDDLGPGARFHIYAVKKEKCFCG